MEHRHLKTSVVITTIFSPTDTYRKVLGKERDVIVIGDKKTPKNWKYKGVNFLSIEDQKKLNFSLVSFLPENHYCRKMLGYLIAIEKGANQIIDTDDDNIPKLGWKFPAFNGRFKKTEKDKNFINVYSYYTKKKIWPRGLPLNFINNKINKTVTSSKNIEVGVWQGLADKDPDVDAIYRLTNGDLCYFNNNGPLVLDKGTITPFNSQNTLFREAVFPLLYLPVYTTFRFTDILRGLVAQPIMWLHGYRLGFTDASVTQKRNSHNLIKDFESEVPMYLHSEKIISIVENVIHSKNNISDNLYEAYKALYRANIVPKKEITCLNSWLKDISRL